MVDAAMTALRDVDVVLAIVDASERGGAGDRFVMDAVRKVTVPRVLALNKVDLLAKESLLPQIERYDRDVGFADIVPISALTGANVDRLEQVVVSHLPAGEPLYPDDYLTDQPERFFVSELVREQVLRHTHAELPFASAVVVDRFEEPDENGVLRLYCTILVERESQKPIVVGKGGAMIKTIGTAARHELERFFGTRVFLDLRVKVRADWREDERTLDTLGLPRTRRERRK
jgi:GTP-binding protein Era